MQNPPRASGRPLPRRRHSPRRGHRRDAERPARHAQRHGRAAGQSAHPLRADEKKICVKRGATLSDKTHKTHKTLKTLKTLKTNNTGTSPRNIFTDMDKLVATVKRKRQELDERVALDALEGLKVGAELTSWEASGVARLSDSPSLAVTFSRTYLPPKKRPVVVNYHVVKILTDA